MPQRYFCLAVALTLPEDAAALPAPSVLRFAGFFAAADAGGLCPPTSARAGRCPDLAMMESPLVRAVCAKASGKRRS